ncbi:DUF6069 family protein [Streptomyces flavalbus]|uniref:DUF6069 family protein n=1 Tax=Streptomyces flavalbus TaxID=2665155 RepID=A0ABW2W9Y6_9ACTN
MTAVRRRRLGATTLAVLTPALIWLTADPLLGHRLRITNGDETLTITAAPVALVALLASLAAWALLAALERTVPHHAHRIWTGASCAVLAVSSLPFLGDGMNPGTRAALALMHVTVAAVLLLGLGGGRSGAPR